MVLVLKLFVVANTKIFIFAIVPSTSFQQAGFQKFIVYFNLEYFIFANRTNKYASRLLSYFCSLCVIFMQRVLMIQQSQCSFAYYSRRRCASTCN